MPTFGHLFNMMKPTITILAAALCLFYSCKQATPDAALKRKADSLDIVTKANKLAREMLKRAEDSAANVRRAKESAAGALSKPMRTFGPCLAVIKTCSVITDGHGSKAIIVTLKNNSTKKIDAVRIAWTVYNKAGKAIGSSRGMAKKALARGRSASYSWGINAANGTRAKASIAGIHYHDGSVWAAVN
jgi:hypothetical protein